MNDFFELATSTTASRTAAEPARAPEHLRAAVLPRLRDAVQSLHDAGSARVLLVCSSGKHFSAGMSLDTFASGDALLDTRRHARGWRSRTPCAG